MQVKTVPAELKVATVEGDRREISGYASTFLNEDLQADRMLPGAFAKTLSERGGRVPLCWSHDWNEPIGRLVEAREDGKGLYVRALMASTTRARDAVSLVEDEVIDSMSIGYETVKSSYNGQVRELSEVKLFEVSLVAIPANPEALITGVKGLDDYVGHLATLSALLAEGKAGRVLSKRNLDALKTAIEALTAVLAAAEPDPVDEAGHHSALLRIKAAEVELALAGARLRAA